MVSSCMDSLLRLAQINGNDSWFELQKHAIYKVQKLRPSSWKEKIVKEKLFVLLLDEVIDTQ